MNQSSPNSTHRVLYRGALSLPDSNLLLDGLTFSAPSTVNLLQNPLALALESMHGRPSLRLMGVVKMRDLWVDKEGDVRMDIHPCATLTKVYFENTFCLEPMGESSECGVRVALGDSTASTSKTTAPSDPTEIIIYARLASSSTVTIQLLVARITPAPPQTRIRLPRPDDPTPRKPPPLLGVDSYFSEKTKRSRQASSDGLATNKKAKIGGTVATLGSDVRMGRKDPVRKGDKMFKIPDLPSRSGRAPDGEEDVFGTIGRNGHVRDRGCGKGQEVRGSREEDGDVGKMELDNKVLVKQSTVHALSLHGITKQHSGFKELFGFVYRGTMFALRNKVKAAALDTRTVDRIVEAHVGMYVHAGGG